MKANEAKLILPIVCVAPVVAESPWKKIPRVRELLKELLRDATAGDPMGGLRWTHKTTRKLAVALKRRGVQASHVTVARLLRRRNTRCDRIASGSGENKTHSGTDSSASWAVAEDGSNDKIGR